MRPLDYEDEQAHDDALDQAELTCAGSRAFFVDKRLFEFSVGLLDVSFGSQNIVVNSIQDSALFNNQAREAFEDFGKLVHLVHNLLYLDSARVLL